MESNKEYTWKKRGFSIIPVMFPAGLITNFFSQASVLVHICADGWVLVTPSGSDLTEETLTKIMQVVSREFRVSMSCIRIGENSVSLATEKDVQLSPYNVQVHLMAVQEACHTLLKRLQPIICLHPNATWKECIQEAFRLKICLSAAAHYRTPDQVSDWELKTGTQSPDFIFGAACSEVELDCRTGNHKNLRTDVVIDVGSTMNEAGVAEQVKNAINRGLGIYINEDLKYVMPSSPTNGEQSNQAADVSSKYMPEQLNVSLLPSSPNPNVKCSPKALEDLSLFLGSSVFFAIKDAILAARQHIGLPGTILLPIPARPQHIRMACGNHLIDSEQMANTQESTVHTAET